MGQKANAELELTSVAEKANPVMGQTCQRAPRRKEFERAANTLPLPIY